MPAATVQMNVRVDPRLATAVRRRAKRDKSTSTAVITAAIIAYLAADNDRGNE